MLPSLTCFACFPSSHTHERTRQVFFTDADKAMTAAIAEFCPFALHRHYIWHAIHNITKRCNSVLQTALANMRLPFQKNSVHRDNAGDLTRARAVDGVPQRGRSRVLSWWSNLTEDNISAVSRPNSSFNVKTYSFCPLRARKSNSAVNLAYP